jgi:predicted transcriptional regulator
VKLNLDSFAKHTTVEFRHHAGTTNTDKIVNWLKVCMAMVECADARRSVRVKDTDSVDSNDNTLRVFFNGLSSVSNLITEDVRRFYTRRQKELGTYVRS